MGGTQKMARTVVSCSITPEQSAFATEKNLNLSAILQNHLDKMMESALNPEFVKELTEDLERVKHNMNVWRDKALNIAEHFRKKGFDEDVDKFF